MEYTIDFTQQEDWEIVAEQATQASESWDHLSNKMLEKRDAKKSKLAFRLAKHWQDIADAIEDIRGLMSEWEGR